MKNIEKKYGVDMIDFVFGILTLLLGYSFVRLILTVWSSAMGYVIFTLLFSGVSLGYIYLRKRRIPKTAIFYYCLTILAVLPLGLYQHNSFSFMSIMITVMLAVYSMSVACGVRVQDKLGDFLLTDLYNSFLYRPFRNFGVQFYSIFMIGTEKPARKKIVTTVFAILISLIIFFVVIGILSGVDDNFEKLVSAIINTFKFSWFLDEILYLFLTLPVSLYLFAMFYSGVNNHNTMKYTEKEILTIRENREAASQILFILPMIVLSSVYLLFFIFHIKTLSSAMNEGGIVYSSYARQGFFELCQISAINILVCLGAMTFCKKNEKQSKAIILLNSLIAFSTLMLMIVATLKLGLYVNMYGLTPKRVHAGWVLFVIFIVFILLLIRQFKKYNFVKIASAVIVLSYITLSLCGITQIVAKYNFVNYANGNLKEFENNYIVNFPPPYVGFNDYEYATLPYIIKQWEVETDLEKKNAMEAFINHTFGSSYSMEQSLPKLTVEGYIAEKLMREKYSNTD